VIPRTPAARKDYRETRFRQHFEAAESQQLVLKGIGFHGRIPNLRNPETYCHLLIALSDSENYVIKLGIIQDIDLSQKTIQLYAPKFEKSKVNFIHFGSIYLNDKGEQIFPEIY